MGVQEHEGQGAQLKHQAAVIQFDQLELEGYGPFRSDPIPGSLTSSVSVVSIKGVYHLISQ